MGLRTFFKDRDMFVHQIGLTFKGNESYNTMIGAFFSIVIYIVIGTYMVLNLIKMFTPGAGDFLGTVEESINIDAQGEIKMSNLHLE